MSIDQNKCHVSGTGNIITAQGRLSYAQFLIDPQERTYEDSGKTASFYSVNLLFPGEGNKQGLPPADLSELKKAMGKLALEKLDGDTKRAKSFVEKRFLDPNNLPQGGKPAGEEFENWILVRATSADKPDFAYPNGKKIPAEKVRDELYSGRWARAILSVYWTANKKNPGVCLGLQGIQLLGHDENIGRASVNVENEFAAFSDSDADGSSVSDDDVDSMFG